jgi:hypothetical protein
MARYGQKFKDAVVARLLPPESSSLEAVSQKVGISVAIGDDLRSRLDERRATEVDVAVHVLNRMLELGRPSYVRIA